jgi:hypothetical protein
MSSHPRHTIGIAATRLKSLAAAAAVALALSAGGCSGFGDPGSSDAGEAPPLPDAPKSGAPAMNETVDQAVERIADVLSSGDCDQINELNPPSRPKLATESRCKALQGLAGLEVEGAAAYGKVAGVVDYKRGDRTVSALLIGDADGRFHVAFIDAFLGVPSVGTERAGELDAAAEGAVRALRRRDCAAFLEVAYRRFGFAGGSDAEVCARVEANPLAALDPDGEARLELLGGNAGYAFYGLDTGTSYLIVIAARQTEAGLPETVPEQTARLPAGAPEYGYLDAVQTNGGQD